MGPAFWMGGGRSCRGGHGRPWWSEVVGGPTPRAERGEVRYLVLDAIRDRPRHGYEIIQTIQDRSGGQYRPSPGVIYPTLQMLEELGHVRVVEEEGRKVYAITDLGTRELDANREAVREFYERFEDEPWGGYAEDFGDMMKRVGRLLKAFRRGARRGQMTPDVMAKIREALDEALTKIEQAFNRPGRR
jgi:DNA-binding PadR family transcriptional regulator